jgi:hypothetical protein
VMRFHGVCGRLVAHPLHENRLLGDTLFKNLTDLQMRPD